MLHNWNTDNTEATDFSQICTVLSVAYLLHPWYLRSMEATGDGGHDRPA